MKTNAYFACLAVVVMSLQPSLPGFSADSSKEPPSIEDVGNKIKETAQAIGDYSSEKGGEVAGVVKSQFDDLKTQTEAHWGTVDRIAREKSKEAADESSIQAERIKKGSKEAWGHVSKGFSDAFSAFRKNWDDDAEPADSDE